MNNSLITVITALNKNTQSCDLYNLISSLKEQNIPICHILIGDNRWFYNYIGYNDKYSENTNTYTENFVKINGIIGKNENSTAELTSIGLMIADTEFVSIADPNIMFDPNHFEQLLGSIAGNKWNYSKRKIWSETRSSITGGKEFEYIGKDEVTIDQNCLIFNRRFGSSAACLYRESKKIEDNLMFEFLTKYAGAAIGTNNHTVNFVWDFDNQHEHLPKLS